MILETMTISSRFCGPSKSGNGGYVCGRIARHISGSANVRLFSPPPLETELRIETEDDVVQLWAELNIWGKSSTNYYIIC